MHALRRQRAVDELRAAGVIRVEDADGTVEIAGGRLVLPGDEIALPLPTGQSGPIAPAGPPARGDVDELVAVALYLARRAARLRLESAAGTLASRLPPLRDYEPTGRPSSRPGR